MVEKLYVELRLALCCYIPGATLRIAGNYLVLEHEGFCRSSNYIEYYRVGVLSRSMISCF